MIQRTKSLVLTTCTMLFTGALAAADPEILKLWPRGAPGEIGNVGVEADTTTPKQGPVAGKKVIRLGNVSEPTLTVFRSTQQSTQQKGTGAAVLVFPGGGYRILAMDLREPKSANGSTRSGSRRC